MVHPFLASDWRKHSFDLDMQILGLLTVGRKVIMHIPIQGYKFLVIFLGITKFSITSFFSFHPLFVCLCVSVCVCLCL